MAKPGVVFVCYGNSCRSIMAEALARHYWGDALRAASVGIVPLGYITAHTLEVLKEAGIPVEMLYSKGFYEIDVRRYDLIVGLTRGPFEPLIKPGYSGRIIRWHVRDPFGQGLGAFREARETIARMVREKLSEWLNFEGNLSL